MGWKIDVLNDGKPVEIIDGWQLTAEQREAHDYLDWTAFDRGEAVGADFFPDPRGGDFAGDVHYLGNFMRFDGYDPEGTFGEWHGFNSDSAFSALVVRFVDEDGKVGNGNMSHVIVGSAHYVG